MKYNDLILKSNKKSQRVGRGISAGKGKTAGRGTKGQKSRAGYSRKPGFEGGQNPLYQRFPKLRGFKSIKKPIENVYTGQLDKVGIDITNKTLTENGIISSEHSIVKLIVKGDITKKHNIKLQSASKNAITMIEKQGGSFSVIDQIMRPSKKVKDNKV